MTISAAGVRQELRAWLAGHSRDVRPLQRALEIVYRDRPRARSFDEMLENVLLTVTRSHELQVSETMGRLEEILNRLLEDLEATRRPGAPTVPREQHQADLSALSETLYDLSSFQDRMRGMAGKKRAKLRTMVRDLLEGIPEASADEIVLATRSHSRGIAMLASGNEVLKAWEQGFTLERIGATPLPLPWRDHPALVERMERMREAMRTFEAAPHDTPAAAARAADDLTRAVTDGTDALRAMGGRWDETSLVEPIPPTSRVAPDPRAAPGSVAADVLDARVRMAALAATTSDPRPEAVFDALHVADVHATAEGRVGEPVTRAGLEEHILSPTQIGELATDPGWLAGFLARLMDGWQRSHMVGPGFGGESFAGLMLAPWGVNQLAQNRGIEKFLRAAAHVSDDVDLIVAARGRRLAIPLADGGFRHVDVLASLHYDIAVPGTGGHLTFDVTVNPDGSWHATHNLPAGVPGADVPLRGTR